MSGDRKGGNRFTHLNPTSQRQPRVTFLFSILLDIFLQTWDPTILYILVCSHYLGSIFYTISLVIKYLKCFIHHIAYI